MVASLLSSLISAYMLILIARAVISWLPLFNVRVDPYNPIVRVIHQLTEPVLVQIRRYMPQTGMVDLSMLILFILLSLLQRVIFFIVPF